MCISVFDFLNNKRIFKVELALITQPKRSITFTYPITFLSEFLCLPSSCLISCRRYMYLETGYGKIFLKSCYLSPIYGQENIYLRLQFYKLSISQRKRRKEIIHLPITEDIYLIPSL